MCIWVWHQIEYNARVLVISCAPVWPALASSALIWIPGCAEAQQCALTDRVTSSSSLPDLLDADFDLWLSITTLQWGLRGLGIAVVRQDSQGAWAVETKGYG